MKFITFGRPSIYKNQLSEINKVLKSGWIGTGKKTFQFEKNFSKYLNVKNSLALSSCTAGLYLSLKSLNLKNGDEVITTPMTFCSTVNSILNAGGKPVLVDINEKTLNIDEKQITKNINKKTKAILVVHFAGRIANIEEIKKICKKFNLFLIEDCAHAIETKFKNKHAGTFGDYGCFSFYVTKNITTNGEGGILISNRKKSLDDIRKISLHGMTKNAWDRYGKKGYKDYDIVAAGYKFNMTNLQAVCGIAQLKNIEKAWKRRRQIWRIYKEKLKNLPITLPFEEEKNSKHAYHLFTIIINSNREHFINYLKKNKIGIGIHYNSIGSFNFYKNKVKNFSKVPKSNYIGERILSLPLYESLKKKELNFIIEKITKYFD